MFGRLGLCSFFLIAAVPLVPALAQTSDGRADIVADHTTIVLVPGILGSQLRIPQFGNDIVWGSLESELSTPKNPLHFLTKYAMGGRLKVLANALERNHKPIVATKVLHEYKLGGVPVVTAYAPLKRALKKIAEAKRFGYREFPYNWTDSIFNNAKELRKFLKFDTEPGVPADPAARDMNYILVAHSMGTLVSLATARTFSDDERERIRAMIFIKGPLRGAPKAYNALISGSIDDPALDFLKSQEQFKRIAYASPGFWELLPRNDFYELGGKRLALVDDKDREFFIEKLLKAHNETRDDREALAYIKMRLDEVKALDGKLIDAGGILPPIFHIVTRYSKGRTQTLTKIEDGQAIRMSWGDGTVPFFNTMTSDALAYYSAFQDGLYLRLSRDSEPEVLTELAQDDYSKLYRYSEEPSLEYVSEVKTLVLSVFGIVESIARDVADTVTTPLPKPGKYDTSANQIMKKQDEAVIPLVDFFAYGLNKGLYLPFGGPNYAFYKFINEAHNSDVTPEMLNAMREIFEYIPDRQREERIVRFDAGTFAGEGEPFYLGIRVNMKPGADAPEVLNNLQKAFKKYFARMTLKDKFTLYYILNNKLYDVAFVDRTAGGLSIAKKYSYAIEAQIRLQNDVVLGDTPSSTRDKEPPKEWKYEGEGDSQEEALDNLTQRFVFELLDRVRSHYASKKAA